MNIPKPFPDEYVLGWRGRIKFFNHHPNVKLTIQELRLRCDRHRSDGDLLIKGASQVFVLAKASKLTLEEFIQRHTLIPFTRAFGPTLDDVTPDELNNLLLTHGLRVGKEGAWYCISCVKQDMQEHGGSYWHRSHQLLGVDWCYKHRHKLQGVNDRAAFDSDPIFLRDRYKLLAVPGPHFLDETEPVIQRYVAISLALLNGKERLNRIKVSALIELQFLARQYIECQGEGGDFNSVLETLVPAYWIDRFVELRTKVADSNILNFKRLFALNIAVQDTERYAVALAILFNSAETAIRQLEQSHEIKLANGKNSPRVLQNPWWGEQVLNEYARHDCCHNSFAEARGIDVELVSNVLAAHGLPNFSNGFDAKRSALNDFFDGHTLSEASEKYNLNQHELEQMLRIASSRLGAALTKIDRAQ